MDVDGLIGFVLVWVRRVFGIEGLDFRRLGTVGTVRVVGSLSFVFVDDGFVGRIAWGVAILVRGTRAVGGRRVVGFF